MESTTTLSPEPAPGDAPDVSGSPTEFRLHPRAAAVWTTITAVVIAVPVTGGTIATLLLELYWVPPLIFGLGALILWLVSRYNRRYVAALRCELSRRGLLVVRGVWWRTEIFVPRERVQHTDIDQGPVARRCGMATLKVFTAGSEHSQIQVDALSHDDASLVRDDLIEPEHRPARGATPTADA